MRSIVIYASHHGNTQKVAMMVAAELQAHGRTDIFPVDDAPTTLPSDVDLVVVGGPTEAHRMTEPMARYLDRLNATGLRGKAAAAFDTRLHGPRWLWGSASVGVGTRLEDAGAHLVVQPESFYVKRSTSNEGEVATMAPGELERAKVWAASAAEAAAPVRV